MLELVFASEASFGAALPRKDHAGDQPPPRIEFQHSEHTHKEIVPEVGG